MTSTSSIRRTPAGTAAAAGTSPAPQLGTARPVKARRGGLMAPIHGAQRKELRNHVIHLYVDHQLPMEAAAAIIGRSYGLVNKLLTEGNIQRRPRGMRRRKTPAAAGAPPGTPQLTIAGQPAVPVPAAAAAAGCGCDRVVSR